MKTPKSILPRLAALEGNLDEELARLALLRSQGKLPLLDGPKQENGQGKHMFTIRGVLEVFCGKFIVSERGCWEWQGPDAGLEYGLFCFRSNKLKAHRFSFAVFHREPEEGVCHHCDNPKCVNPDHLFEGSQTDNMVDCARKKRFNPREGEHNIKAKLTASQVLEIRASVLSPHELAEKYGMSRCAIYHVQSGYTWAHLPL